MQAARKSATKGHAVGMFLPRHLGAQVLSLYLGIGHKIALKETKDYPKSTLRWVQGRVGLLCILEGGIFILGGCLLDSPFGKTVAPFWIGSLPASALAPS